MVIFTEVVRRLESAARARAKAEPHGLEELLVSLVERLEPAEVAERPAGAEPRSPATERPVMMGARDAARVGRGGPGEPRRPERGDRPERPERGDRGERGERGGRGRGRDRDRDRDRGPREREEAFGDEPAEPYHAEVAETDELEDVEAAPPGRPDVEVVDEPDVEVVEDVDPIDDVIRGLEKTGHVTVRRRPRDRERQKDQGDAISYYDIDREPVAAGDAAEPVNALPVEPPPSAEAAPRPMPDAEVEPAPGDVRWRRVGLDAPEPPVGLDRPARPEGEGERGGRREERDRGPRRFEREGRGDRGGSGRGGRSDRDRGPRGRGLDRGEGREGEGERRDERARPEPGRDVPRAPAAEPQAPAPGEKPASPAAGEPAAVVDPQSSVALPPGELPEAAPATAPADFLGGIFEGVPPEERPQARVGELEAQRRADEEAREAARRKRAAEIEAAKARAAAMPASDEPGFADGLLESPRDRAPTVAPIPEEFAAPPAWEPPIATARADAPGPETGLPQGVSVETRGAPAIIAEPPTPEPRARERAEAPSRLPLEQGVPEAEPVQGLLERELADAGGDDEADAGDLDEGDSPVAAEGAAPGEAPKEGDRTRRRRRRGGRGRGRGGAGRREGGGDAPR